MIVGHGHRTHAMLHGLSIRGHTMLRASEGPNTRPPQRVFMHLHEGEPRSPREARSSRPSSYTGCAQRGSTHLSPASRRHAPETARATATQFPLTISVPKLSYLNPGGAGVAGTTFFFGAGFAAAGFAAAGFAAAGFAAAGLAAAGLAAAGLTAPSREIRNGSIGRAKTFAKSDVCKSAPQLPAKSSPEVLKPRRRAATRAMAVHHHPLVRATAPSVPAATADLRSSAQPAKSSIPVVAAFDSSSLHI